MTAALPLAALPALEAAGLVEFVPGLGEPTYRFRHALIADAAYDSLLKHERRALHGAVGMTLERLYEERPEQVAARLATHFDEAGDEERAYRYARLAGESAARRYALPEAIALLGRALALSRDRQPWPDDHGGLIRTYGRALEIAGRQDQALDAYRDLELRARERGDGRAELVAVIGQAILRAGQSDQHRSDEGVALADRAIELARALGDREGEARALWSRELAALFLGRPAEVVHFGEASLAIAAELGLTSLEAHARLELGHVSLMTLRPALGAEHLPAAAARFAEVGDQAMLTDALSSDAYRLVLEGRLDEALERSGEAKRIAVETGNAWAEAFAGEPTGYVHFERAEIGRAIVTWEESIRLAGSVGYQGALVTPGLELASAYALVGAHERAAELGQQAVNAASQTFGGLDGLVVGTLGWLRLRRGDLDGARERFAAFRARASALLTGDEAGLAISIEAVLADAELEAQDGRAGEALERLDRIAGALEARGVARIRPAVDTGRARILLATGRPGEAVEAARAAVRATHPRDDRIRRWPALATLAEAARSVGSDDEADRATAELRSIFEDIRDGLDDADLRASFVAQPEIAAILGPRSPDS